MKSLHDAFLVEGVASSASSIHLTYIPFLVSLRNRDVYFPSATYVYFQNDDQRATASMKSFSLNSMVMFFYVDLGSIFLEVEAWECCIQNVSSLYSFNALQIPLLHASWSSFLLIVPSIPQRESAILI